MVLILNKGDIITKDNNKYYLNDNYIKSSTSLEYVCENCEKQVTRSSVKRFENKDGLLLCKQCKIKYTNLKKYGVECVYQSDDIKYKIKQTNLEKHGVENPQQNEKIKEKTKKTMDRKYSGSGNGSKILKEKIELTNIEKYGYRYPMQNSAISNKSLNVRILNNPEDPTNKLKRKQTMVMLYGVEYPLQNPNILKKSLSSNGRKMHIKTYKSKFGNISYQTQPELECIKTCENNNISIWNGPSIPYTLEDKKHIYHVDFETDKYVIEIKASHGWYKKDLASGKIDAKNKAAEIYAKSVDKKFKFLLDVKDFKELLI